MSARRNRFKPNYNGYREVMNGPDAMRACEAQAHSLAGSASAQSGMDYTVDSMRGLNRIHTRVSTDGTIQSYMRERHYGALSIALGAAGGQVNARGGGYRTLGGRVKAARKKWETKGKQTGWRAPGFYRKKR